MIKKKKKQVVTLIKVEKDKLRPVEKFLLVLLFMVVCYLFYELGHYYKPKLVPNNTPDFSINKSDINNIPNNLSIHLCSTDCVYTLILDDTTRINDSFIINNKLNSSNCVTCYKTDWKFENE